MHYTCFNCSKEVTLNSSGTVGRKEECESCGADLHCCKNCKFYDPASYNECAENQAERVVDKERGNFCDYFSYMQGSGSASKDSKSDTLKELDSLFK